MAVTQVWPPFLNFEAMRSFKPAFYPTWMRILLAVTQVWPLFLNLEAMSPLTAASRSAELKIYRFSFAKKIGKCQFGQKFLVN